VLPSFGPRPILHARGIPGTGKALAVLSGHHTHQRGKLAIIGPSRGRQETSVGPSRGRQETSGVTLVAPVQTLQGIMKIDRYGQRGDQWQYPCPLDENNYLVTFRPQGRKRFGVYFMNKDGRRVLLASDPASPWSATAGCVSGRHTTRQRPRCGPWSTGVGIVRLNADNGIAWLGFRTTLVRCARLSIHSTVVDFPRPYGSGRAMPKPSRRTRRSRLETRPSPLRSAKIV